MNIAIIGLGLIGGSFAKSIKARTDHTVYGCDLDAEVRMLARLCGAIDGVLDVKELSDCELILVGLTPSATIEWVTQNAKFLRGSVVIDVCGVKRLVCEKLSDCARKNEFLFLGGHPMAGRECSGFVNARENLFDGASMVLTPDESVDLHTLEWVKEFFIDLGFARLTFSTPENHDRIIAYTSQLAHVVSSAFVQSPTASNRRGFSAGSYQDLTRVARLNEEMWAELMLANADNLSAELHIFMKNMQRYVQAIDTCDAQALKECLRDGRIAKANAGGN